MKRHMLLRLTRPALLTASVLTVLVLGWSGTAWETQAQGGGTIPVATQKDPGSGSKPTATSATVATPAVPPPTVEGQGEPPVVGPVPVGPDSAVVIVSGNHFCQVGITRGDLAEEGTLQLNYITADQMPTTANGYTFAGGGGCDLVFTPASAATRNQHDRFVAFRQPPDSGIVFVSPIDICLFYTDAQLSAVNGQVGAFQVLFNNVATLRWEPLNVTVDQDNRMVCGQTQKTGQYGLAHQTLPGPLPGSLPDTSGPRLVPSVHSGVPQSAPQSQAVAPTSAPSATAPVVAATPVAPTVAAPEAIAALPATAVPLAPAVVNTAPLPDTPWSTLVWVGFGILAVIAAAGVLVLRRRQVLK